MPRKSIQNMSRCFLFHFRHAKMKEAAAFLFVKTAEHTGTFI
ncbi:hypothetical protein KR50_29700 [Jeotgalibacillus campisalis]|uniref:Uncharacterized protein n=1 Tax=Jeotgalibacillus campisalis TaxID=220754 RepID=A0A0C2R7S0_9BACL|nr:hypothetical protein KR50_29700 [Jeotgalibacillus campisalis]